MTLRRTFLHHHVIISCHHYHHHHHLTSPSIFTCSPGYRRRLHQMCSNSVPLARLAQDGECRHHLSISWSNYHHDIAESPFNHHYSNHLEHGDNDDDDDEDDGKYENKKQMMMMMMTTTTMMMMMMMVMTTTTMTMMMTDQIWWKFVKCFFPHKKVFLSRVTFLVGNQVQVKQRI